MMPDLKKVKNFCLLKQEDKGEPKIASADKFLMRACKSKSSREGCFPARRAARKSAIADKFPMRACAKKRMHTGKSPVHIRARIHPVFLEMVVQVII